MHTPVLLDETLALLQPKPGAFFIDGTVDGGGHARAILERIAPRGKFLGVDWDERMIAQCKKAFGSEKRATFVCGNYADLPAMMKKKRLGRADGLFLDLGFSSAQLEDSGRGFSFLKDEPLLMTYSRDCEPVRDLLKRIGERDLGDILFRLSGERFARRIAKAVKEETRRGRMRTTGDLSRAVMRAVPRHYERGRIHPATRTFQALRVYANDELRNLEQVLSELPRILARGGRAAVITFHSLEDRVAKNAFRSLEKSGTLRVLTKKPVVPTADEVRRNPRSRSAKLRGAILT